MNGNHWTRINGEPQMQVDASDRGLRYGDSLFETIAWRDGRLEWLARHVERLRAGAMRLRLDLPNATRLTQQIQQDVAALLQDAAQPAQAVIRIQITRGTGGRGYNIDGATAPLRIASLHVWPWLDGAGKPRILAPARVRFCSQTLAAQPALAGIKHGNRLEQILARMEWGGADASGWDEGLMSDAEGRIIEGTMSNLFIIHQGALHTPALDRCGIAGIVRGVVIDLAERLSIPVRIGTLNRVFLERAQALFLSNSLAGIWPVGQLGERALQPDAEAQALLDQLQRGLSAQRAALEVVA